MRRRRQSGPGIVLLATFAIALFAVGCGDNGSSSTDSISTGPQPASSESPEDKAAAVVEDFAERQAAQDPSACELLTPGAIESLQGYTNSFSGSCEDAIREDEFPFHVDGVSGDSQVDKNPSSGQSALDSYAVPIELSEYGGGSQGGTANVIEQGSGFKIDWMSP